MQKTSTPSHYLFDFLTHQNIHPRPVIFDTGNPNHGASVAGTACRDDDDLSCRDGGVSLSPYVSWAGTSEERSFVQDNPSLQHPSKNEPLWKPDRKQPRAGRVVARPECRRACENVARECTGKCPLEGVAGRVLDCGRQNDRQRRSGVEVSSSQRKSGEGEESVLF